MKEHITRWQLIQIWFGAVILVAVACIAFDIAITGGTAAVLLGAAFVPPIILLVLWPGVQPPTANEVLHEAERPRPVRD